MAREPHSRSFNDALSLARNIRDQATIYYRRGETRAIYDVVTDRSAKYHNTGTCIINGRCLTVRDIPPVFQSSIPASSDPDALVLVEKRAKVAQEIFEHMGVSSEIGWDVRP